MRFQLFNHHCYSSRACVFLPATLLSVVHSTKAQGDRQDVERDQLTRQKQGDGQLENTKQEYIKGKR